MDDPRTGRRLLRRARDEDKDQSYFLFDLDPEQLRAAEFPLGDLTKDEVRARARELGLKTADKPESMDLCFVTEGSDYREALARRGLAPSSGPGPIVDDAGRVLGSHDGIEAFTVGQRRGIGIASDRPRYVLRINSHCGCAR